MGSDCGVTHGTARSWVSVLEASFVAYRLPPLHSNLNKRIVKTPKLHFYDTGLVCYLLGIRSPDELRGHPLRGAIFETWVAAEVVKAHYHRGAVPALFFFRDRKGQEVDLVLDRGLDRLAIETKSAQTVAEDFFAGLEALERIAPAGRPWRRMVVYGGQHRQERSRATVLPWAELDALDWIG